MSNTKKGLRALGLSFLAVLGFMAFAAAGAQAQTPGKFLDAGGELAVGTKATGVQEKPGSLLVANLNMAILCQTADVEEGVVTAKEGGGVGGTAHATIKFLTCTVDTAALVALGACVVKGGSVTAKVKLLARLASEAHGKEAFVLAEPLTAGTPFATIVIANAEGKFCSVSGTYEALGSLALKPLAGNNNPQLVIPYANQALLGDELLLGKNPAVLDAQATIEITTAGLAGAAFGVC